MGYLLKWTEGGARVELEADTLSCTHCQKVMTKADWKKRGAWCFKCGHAICPRCHGLSWQTGCVPFMQQVEHALRRQRILRDI